MRDAFIARLHELAASDPRITLITGDLGFKVLDKFADSYPRQFVNAGVAEQNMTGLATGLALEGRIVFTYSIANFSTLRCLEQIRNDAAYHGANVKVVAVGGGFSYGSLGISHHATEDIAVLRAMPDVAVVCPGDDWEAAEATTAIVKREGTCYLRLDRSSAETSAPQSVFELGTARVVAEGRDLTLISTGGMLGTVLATRQKLLAAGLECRVVSMHTVSPLDRGAVVRAARETGGVVTVEEHTVNGGLGGAVAEALLDDGAQPRVFIRFGLRDGFSSIVGSQDYLRRQYGLDAETIVARIVDRVQRSGAAGR